MLDGDVAALREVFPLVDRCCTALGDLVDGWGAELDLFGQPIS
jgi:hypothetical protein